MNLIPISSIIISPNRQRRTFDAGRLQEFADGIARRGLLHAVVLREQEGRLVLVAGERRIRAISALADLDTPIHHNGEEVPLGQIPYTLFSDLDPLAAEEAELEENIHREDLSWQDRAAAVARLKSLRDKQAAARGEPPTTVAAIAEEVRGSSEGAQHDDTRKELIIAKHLDDPEVRAAKSPDEAWKVLKRKEAAKKNEELGAVVGRTFTAEAHQAFNLDAANWLAGCPDGQFDCILTDPPYGMGADAFGDSGGLAAGAHGYVDDEASFRKALEILLAQSIRVTKAQAHLYLFCDPDRFTAVREAFTAVGWRCFRTPLIWHKPSAMRAPWPEHGPQRRYEMFVYATKGNRPILKIAPDLVTYQPDANLGHAAQKPVALYADLLARSVRPGDAVLDPFCGSGPIFPAAHGMKVRATGIEIDTASYGVAVKRIAALGAQKEIAL